MEENRSPFMERFKQNFKNDVSTQIQTFREVKTEIYNRPFTFIAKTTAGVTLGLFAAKFILYPIFEATIYPKLIEARIQKKMKETQIGERKA